MARPILLARPVTKRMWSGPGRKGAVRLRGAVQGKHCLSIEREVWRRVLAYKTETGQRWINHVVEDLLDKGLRLHELQKERKGKPVE